MWLGTLFGQGSFVTAVFVGYYRLSLASWADMSGFLMNDIGDNVSCHTTIALGMGFVKTVTRQSLGQ